MGEYLQIALLPLVLTLGGFQIGVFCQKKTKSAICNPILIAVAVVLLFSWVTKLDIGSYRKGMDVISWLLTPATVCLAIPMYEQLQVLKKNFRAVLSGILGGTISSLGFILVFALAVGFERSLTVSLLPKSVTTAIGVPLSQLCGGVASITTAAIVFTGIFANVMSGVLIRLFRLSSSVAKGVALGTAGHVIGTARANEIDSLAGAVSSLSLVVAGVLTAVVFPLVLMVI